MGLCLQLMVSYQGIDKVICPDLPATTTCAQSLFAQVFIFRGFFLPGFGLHPGSDDSNGFFFVFILIPTIDKDSNTWIRLVDTPDGRSDLVNILPTGTLF